MGRTWCVWLLALGVVTGCNPIEYVYDGLGRLIAVIDPATDGQTAVYAYDAVGNVVGIDRFATTHIAVIDVTPHCAPAGTSVTIRGTAFDPQASRNTVRFNGLAARISSASATSLVARVPSGSTAGDVSVKSAAGTATKAAGFAGPCGGPPVVTGFTPDLGVVGMPITITGTNFDPVLFNDAVAFNGTAGTVYAATSGTIQTAVPALAATGPLTVTNTYGTGMSALAFEVVPPPAGYTADDVDVVLRMILGETRTFPIAADKIALIRFAVPQSTHLGITRLGGVTTCLLDPTGASFPSCFDTSFQLTAVGTYTLLVVPGAFHTPATATITLAGT